MLALRSFAVLEQQGSSFVKWFGASPFLLANSQTQNRVVVKLDGLQCLSLELICGSRIIEIAAGLA